VWYELEDRGFELMLVNARHVKILPGRKSDVLDAEWLAELLEHGLLRGSFVPPAIIRELRDLTRYRKRLVQSHTSEARLRSKHAELQKALRGRFREHHAVMIGMALDHVEYLEASIGQLDERIDALFAANTSEAGVPFSVARDRLATIPGIAKRAAESIIAEIGVDMSRFPTAGHLASWAGMARQQHQRWQATLRQDHQRRQMARRNPQPMRVGGVTQT